MSDARVDRVDGKGLEGSSEDSWEFVQSCLLKVLSKSLLSEE